MRANLESWMLALIAHRGGGRAEVVAGRSIIAGRVVVEPFGDDFPTLDHERFVDAKIALLHLTRSGQLRAVARGSFVLTEVGEQRVALEEGVVDLRAFPLT